MVLIHEIYPTSRGGVRTVPEQGRAAPTLGSGKGPADWHAVTESIRSGYGGRQAQYLCVRTVYHSTVQNCTLVLNVASNVSPGAWTNST